MNITTIRNSSLLLFVVTPYDNTNDVITMHAHINEYVGHWQLHLKFENGDFYMF